MFVSKYVTSETNAWKYYNFDKSRYTNPKYIICNFILKKKIWKFRYVYYY